LNDCHRIV